MRQAILSIVIVLTVLSLKAMTLARMGEMEKAATIFQYALSVAKHRYQKEVVYYAYANFLSLQGQYDTAMAYLKEAIMCGFDNFSHIMLDEDLIGLRESAYFEKWKEALSHLFQ